MSSSEVAWDLAQKIFGETAGQYPKVFSKKVADYSPEDLAKIFSMLGEICAETTKAIEDKQLTDLIEVIDLAGLILDAIKNNCTANLSSLAKLKQLTLMRRAEKN